MLGVQCAEFSVWRAVFIVYHAVCSVKFIVCDKLCSACSI